MYSSSLAVYISNQYSMMKGETYEKNFIDGMEKPVFLSLLAVAALHICRKRGYPYRGGTVCAAKKDYDSCK